MSSSAFEPDDAADRERSPEDADQMPDRNFLERVLRETILATETSEPIAPAEMDSLSKVARRHHSAALTLDPVAVDLVHSILRARFSFGQSRTGFWKTMSRQIAGTLMDDPGSRERLTALWDRLREASR